MKLSVIIACFNASDTIAIQLESLTNQHWSEPWEIIISDNGSTDNTLTIIEQYKERLPNLCIVDSSDRKGAAYARNVGVLAATADALAFCDADDKIAPGWVAAMGEALSKHDFVAGRLEPKEINESWVLKSRFCPQQTGLQEYQNPPYLPHSASCNLGIKRSLHESVGGFDEFFKVLQDTDYCWRVQLVGSKLLFVPNAVVYYRFRNTLGGIYRQARAYGEGNILLCKKYQLLGVPNLWKSSLAASLDLLVRLPKVFLGKGRRANWVWWFGWWMGRLQGCIKYRVWCSSTCVGDLLS